MRVVQTGRSCGPCYMIDISRSAESPRGMSLY